MKVYLLIQIIFIALGLFLYDDIVEMLLFMMIPLILTVSVVIMFFSIWFIVDFIRNIGE